jgi:hypothetical protein
MDIIIPTNKSNYAIAPLICNIEGFSQGHRVFATCCQKGSAATNRNIGLEWAKSEIVIMVDDDMAGFFEGWVEGLIGPLVQDKNVVMVSARLTRQDGSNGAMMFSDDSKPDFAQVPRLMTACVAFRKEDIRFDEGFIGSGFEDDDYCAMLSLKYPKGKFLVNNQVRLIHLNEMKNQSGEFYVKNKERFDKKWTTVNQNTTRVPTGYLFPNQEEKPCTILSTGKTSGSTTISSKENEKESSLKPEPSMESLPATPSSSNKSLAGPDSSSKPTPSSTERSKKTGSVKKKAAVSETGTEKK